MAFSISSVSPEKIHGDGGRAIVVTGVFEAGHRYRVHLGDLGTVGDPPCYSGIPGQGNIVYAKASEVGGIMDQLTVYSPFVNPSATAYDIVVIDVDTSEVHLLSGVVTAMKKQFHTTVYAMKKIQHPDYYLGPRSIEMEKPT